MWYQEKKNGTYLQERVRDPLTGRSRIVSVKVSGNGNKARKEAQRRLQEKIDGFQPQRLHLSDLKQYYLDEHKRSVRESTYTRDEYALNAMLKITDDIYVDQMTAGYIRRKMIESGKENGTLNELIKRFRTFLFWAYRNDYIPDRSIPDKLTLFPDKTAREKIANKFLEKSELHALVKAMDNERWKLLTEFLALSGLRVGEAIALTDDAVESEYIHVTETYSEQLALLGPAKTATSIRDVYIQPELAGVIRKIRVYMKKQRMRYGYEEPGYFFVSQYGKRIGYAAYNHYLKDTAKLIVPDKDVSPHTLRHTMTSLFAEAGIPLDVISRRLGHENSDITKRIYLHITETRKVQENLQVSTVTLLA
jgi:integrase